jgi:hypothetical protein
MGGSSSQVTSVCLLAGDEARILVGLDHQDLGIGALPARRRPGVIGGRGLGVIGVDVQRPEHPREALVFGDGEPLIAEDQHVMGVQRRRDARELAVGQRPREIDAADLRPDHRVERGDGDRLPVRGG